MSAIELDRFLRFDELTRALHEVATDHPELVDLESIGRSHEGREIWLVTVTDKATGPHDTKPAMWVDGNIHATELTGSVAALGLIEHLVSRFATDARVARALRARTFYVVPRVNPDGAELALADRPRLLRSSTRPWPWRDGHRPPGLFAHDVDGDGRVLRMRIPDPDGAWRTHPDDPRLLVAREPDADPAGGPFYRVLVEGTIADHDGFTTPSAPPPEGLDLNRNYPAGWSTSVRGAGDHPLSEPEIDAVVRAITARPNVCGFNAYHTFGGVLLRPSSTRPDSALPPTDVLTWNELGARLTATSGYRVHSVYEDFTWDREVTMSGASDDWAYEHLGIYAWTTELWDPIAMATGERAPTKLWYTGPAPADELAVLRWADEHAPGEMFVDWYSFDHPQLGAVELGGWDELRSWTNPPAAFLRAEVAPHADFAVLLALAAPELAIRDLRVEPLGDGTWRVRAGIVNAGWLPTEVTAWAAKTNLVLPVVAELLAGDDGAVTVVDVPARRELGQLAGRSASRLGAWYHGDGSPDRATVSWIVRGASGAEVTVEARHPRAGTVRASVGLGA